MGYWQSQYTSPFRSTTAHQGASPKARLGEVPNDVAAARAAIPNISFAGASSTMSCPFFGCMYVLNKHRNSAPHPCRPRPSEIISSTPLRSFVVRSWRIGISNTEAVVIYGCFALLAPHCGRHGTCPRQVALFAGTQSARPSPRPL